MKITCQHQNHGYFHKLRRLQLDKAEVNPAGGAHTRMPGHFHHHQKNQRNEIKYIGITQQQLNVCQRQHNHYRKPHAETYQLVNRPRAPIAVGRRIQHDNADGGKNNNKHHIRKTDVIKLFANSHALVSETCFIRFIHFPTCS